MLKIFLTLLLLFPLTGKADDKVMLNSDNTIILRGVVDNASVLETMLELAAKSVKRGSDNYTLYLVLDSPGGSIAAGMDLIRFAKSIKNLKTISIFAASMASAIVEALPGERLAVEDATLMFHRASGRFGGTFGEGEVESQLKYAKSLVTKLETVNASRMKLSLKTYRKMVKDELWLFGNDNLTNNTVDKIVNVECTKELTDKRIKSVVRVIIFDVDVEHSGCPLIREPIAVGSENNDSTTIIIDDELNDFSKEYYNELRRN